MIAALLFAVTLATGAAQAPSKQGPQPSPEPRPDVVAFFRDAVGTLSGDNPAGFLDYFDPDMKDYSRLRDEVLELVARVKIDSSVKFMRDSGNDAQRQVELDWVLGMEGQEERRAAVKCRIDKRGKKWKITAIDPIGFFRYDQQR